MRRLLFVTGQYYHLFNRGVERRALFEEDADRIRFMESIKRFQHSPEKPHLDQMAYPLVQFVAFVLMPDHFHFLVRQEADEGITTFMHQLGTGYSMYFNKKIKRTGRLYEGPFKARQIDEDALLAMTTFIHMNPILHSELPMDPVQRTAMLNQYIWSSYLDYIGARQGTLSDRNVGYAQLKSDNPATAYQRHVESRILQPDFSAVEPLLIDVP